jgi:hypothetical protein
MLIIGSMMLQTYYQKVYLKYKNQGVYIKGKIASHYAKHTNLFYFY